jgi:S1-C subfamily serine protease
MAGFDLVIRPVVFLLGNPELAAYLKQEVFAMNDATNLLSRLSAALESQTAASSKAVAAIRFAKAAPSISALIWDSDLLVTSEQSVPRDGAIEVATGGERVAAKIIGRDPQTNIALLKVDASLSTGRSDPAEARPGGIVLAFGATSDAIPTVRMGLVKLVSPEWFTQAGGRIDRFVSLDIQLSRHEEGGPVFDAGGGLIGMSTFGPRRRVLVIPTSTIDRIVPQLLSGGIKRGWIGAKLQRVAIPDALVGTVAQSSGLMVMSLADNAPAAKAGLVLGDIILAIDGVSIHSQRGIAARFGGESIGGLAEIQVIRGGSVFAVKVVIGERPTDD